MNSDNIVREVARFSNGFHQLVEELVIELKAHEALIEQLEKRLIDLEQKGSQPVSIKIDGDIGERLDALEGRVEELESREESHTEDDIRQWAREEADEALSNASFTVTVD